MIRKFLFQKVSSKQALLTVAITIFAIFAIVFLSWYFFAYLPSAQYRANNRKIDERIRYDAHELRLRYPTSSFPEP